MGRIRIERYQSQTRAPGPVNAPSAPQANAAMFGAPVGAGLQDAAAGITKAAQVLQQRAEQSEISDMNAFFAKTRADFTEKWNATIANADPSDKEVSTRFMEDYQKHLSAYQGNISSRAGQMFFERQSAEMGAQFQMTAQAGQSELAGEKAKSDYQTTVGNLSSSLMNDPSSFDSVMLQHNQSLDGLVQSGALPKQAAIQLRQRYAPDLAKSALRGWIRMGAASPEKDGTTPMLDGVEQGLNDGKWDTYINGDAKHQMLGELGIARNTAMAAHQRALMEAERAKKDAQNSRQTEYLQKLFGNNESFNIQEVLNDNVLDSFGSGSKQQLVSMALEYNKQGGKIKKDPSMVIKLFQQIHSPENDPSHISDENYLNQFFGKGLDNDALQMLRSEISGKKTAEGAMNSQIKTEMIKTAEKVLAGPNQLGMVDPEGAANYTRYLSDFLAEWDQQIRAGVPARRLVDPKAPEYMGNRFQQYMKTPQDIISSRASAFGGSAVNTNPFGPPLPPERLAPPPTGDPDKARRKDESPADYLRRRKVRE